MNSGMMSIDIDAKTLMYRLSMIGVCFGEGPRYSKTKIDNVVRNLLRERSMTVGSERPVGFL